MVLWISTARRRAPRNRRPRLRPGACGFQHLEPHLGAVGQERAAPAPRPEGLDRGQRQKRRIDRHDRPLGGEIVGGRAGRGRHQHPVADQFGDAWRPSTRMRILAAWRVSRNSDTSLKARPRAARPGVRASSAGDGSRPFRRRPAARADRPRDIRSSGSRRCRGSCHRSACRLHEAVQGLQHEAVAAERDDDVGFSAPHCRSAGRAGAAPPRPRRSGWPQRQCAQSSLCWLGSVVVITCSHDLRS